MKSHPARTFLEENQDFSINNFDKRREYPRVYILEKIFKIAVVKYNYYRYTRFHVQKKGRSRGKEHWTLIVTNSI